jgi:hypothetical protein
MDHIWEKIIAEMEKAAKQNEMTIPETDSAVKDPSEKF